MIIRREKNGKRDIQDVIQHRLKTTQNNNKEKDNNHKEMTDVYKIM